MLILDFFKKYPNEESCKNHLREVREKQGMTCTCGCTKHYWFNKQALWKCSKCGKRTNLRSGTIMEYSKLPLQYWFITIHLVTSTKKSFSALELQRQLGHKRYQPVWDMLHKIRVQMGKRDGKYKLMGNVEIDEGMFEVVKAGVKYNKLKMGRGSQRQTPVLVMVESTPLTATELKAKTNKHTPNKKAGHVKMIVISDAKERTINYEVGKAIDNNAVADTDYWQGYSSLYALVDTHNRMKVSKKEVHTKLPWVHTFISNAKRLMLGVHHSVGEAYLQNYLNEYVYKLNRRYLDADMFDRMLIAGVESAWYK